MYFLLNEFRIAIYFCMCMYNHHIRMLRDVIFACHYCVWQLAISFISSKNSSAYRLGTDDVDKR